MSPALSGEFFTISATIWDQTVLCYGAILRVRGCLAASPASSKCTSSTPPPFQWWEPKMSLDIPSMPGSWVAVRRQPLHIPSKPLIYKHNWKWLLSWKCFLLLALKQTGAPGAPANFTRIELCSSLIPGEAEVSCSLLLGQVDVAWGQSYDHPCLPNPVFWPKAVF